MDHYKDIQTIANILFVAENYGEFESNDGSVVITHMLNLVDKVYYSIKIQ
jgi:hypothetical protein